MFVVSGGHLLDVVVVFAVDADVLPGADPVAGIGHGVSDWRVGLSPAPDCWIPAGRYAIMEMAPLPIPATPRKAQCAQGRVHRVRPARGEGALRQGSGDATGNSGCGAGARHSSARAGVGGNWGAENLRERTLPSRRSRRWQPCCDRSRPVRVNYDWPGQVEAAAVSAVVGQLRRSVLERTGACYLLQRQGEGRAKGVSRSAGVAVLQEDPGCRVVSVHHLLDDVDVDRSVIAPAGFGFRLGRRERNPQTPQPGLGTQRDQSLRPRHPSAGAINSGQRTGAQQPGGISSQPLNGARRKKDLNTPAAGLPNGRRA